MRGFSKLRCQLYNILSLWQKIIIFDLTLNHMIRKLSIVVHTKRNYAKYQISLTKFTDPSTFPMAVPTEIELGSTVASSFIMMAEALASFLDIMITLIFTSEIFIWKCFSQCQPPVSVICITILYGGKMFINQTNLKLEYPSIISFADYLHANY